MAMAAAEAASVPMRPAAILALLAVSLSGSRAGHAQTESFASVAVSTDMLPTIADTPEQWNAHGRALYDARRYRESIAAFERSLQLRADVSDDGAWHIARAYAQLGNKKQALRWLTHARQLGFRNEQAHRDEPAFEKCRGKCCGCRCSRGCGNKVLRVE